MASHLHPRRKFGAVTLDDPAAHRIEGHYIELTESGTRLRPYAIRYAAPAELDALAEEAGLRLVERHADWRRAPYEPGASTDHVSLYRPAG